MAAVASLRARHLARARPERHHARLRAELDGTPALDWPRPDGTALARPGACRVGVVPVVLDPAAVDAGAARAGVTRFVILLAAYAQALADLTGQRDFAVGVPVRQRHGSGELDRAVGCHIDTVCMRLRGDALAADDATAVAATAGIVRRALAAQDVTFVDLVELLGPTRSTRPAIYQTMFALHDNPVPRLDLDGVATRFLRLPYLDLPVELHAEVWPDDSGGLRVDISHRSADVASATAEPLARLLAERLGARSGARP